MKLKNLNGLIRKNDGSVKLKLVTAHGVVTVGLIKSELIAGLAEAHPDNNAETGLTIVDGFLAHETDGDRFSARAFKEANPEIVEVDADLDFLGAEDDLLLEESPDDRREYRGVAEAADDLDDLLG